MLIFWNKKGKEPHIHQVCCLSKAVIALELHFWTLLKNKRYIVNASINKQLLFFVRC